MRSSSDGLVEVFAERDRFVELTNADFDVDVEAGVVRLHIHELGTFQAFEVRP